ncbi:MAG: helicase C-terminal domain-containing protein [Candidatus Micrarchaeaceae archaeon]
MLTLPTVKLADEIYKRAVMKDLKAEVILGRNNYICGYKTQLEKIEIDTKDERSLRYDNYGNQFRQDYVCCNRLSCSFDAYNYNMQRVQLSSPNVIITTHALFKNICLTNDKLPFDVDVVVIDEIHSFIASLKSPAPFSKIRISDIILLLKEILQDNFSSQTKRLSKTLKDKLEKMANAKHSTIQLATIVDEKNNVKTCNEYAKKEFHEILSVLESELTQIRDSMPKKSKNAEKITLKTLTTETLSTIRLIQKVNTSGQYAYIRKVNNDIELGLMQILFSSAFWSIFNTIMQRIKGIEIIGMSATVPERLTKVLFGKLEYNGNKNFIFENSHLNLYVYDKDYSYEDKYINLDMAINLTEKLVKLKPVVILTTSYQDIKYLSDKLSHYNLLIQDKGLSDDIIEKFNTGNYAVLIGNRALWEGINIRKDCYFILTKIPYFSPEDIDYKALEEYSLKNSFVLNKDSAYLTLIQGLGRVIRENNQIRTAFITDARFRDFADVIRELPCSVDVAFFSEKHLKEIKEIKAKPISKDFLCLYSRSTAFVLKEKKIEKKLISKEKESCNDLTESFEKRYKRVCGRIVEAYINMFRFFGTEIDYDYIIAQTGTSYVYVKKIEKGEDDEI